MSLILSEASRQQYEHFPVTHKAQTQEKNILYKKKNAIIDLDYTYYSTLHYLELIKIP